MIYDKPAARVDTATVEGVVAAGGIVLVAFSPAGDEPASTGRLVRVRGTTGKIVEIGEGDFLQKVLEWREPEPNGRGIVWWLQVRAQDYPDDRAVSLAESLARQ